ncbi:hypothetical protein HDV02_004820 [Globomyces sp. JEL0801]|nr:hypothetical protein HDV02_004820 [Globomyces sp. JEL0801]
MLTVAGWGDIRNGSNTGSDIMRETTVELNTRATCQKVWPKLSQTSLCAGDLLGGKDSCQGDSGGPLFTKTTPPVLVGVVSYGTDCGKTAGVYTNVALLLPWINKVWKGIDTPVVTATATQGVPVPSTTGKSSALIQTANICLSLGLLLTSFFWQ